MPQQISIGLCLMQNGCNKNHTQISTKTHMFCLATAACRSLLDPSGKLLCTSTLYALYMVHRDDHLGVTQLFPLPTFSLLLSGPRRYPCQFKSCCCLSKFYTLTAGRGSTHIWKMRVYSYIEYWSMHTPLVINPILCSWKIQTIHPFHAGSKTGRPGCLCIHEISSWASWRSQTGCNTWSAQRQRTIQDIFKSYNGNCYVLCYVSPKFKVGVQIKH